MRIKRAQMNMLLAERSLRQMEAEEHTTKILDQVRCDLESRGITADMSAMIAVQVCQRKGSDKDTLTPDQYEALIDGAALACGVHGDAERDLQADLQAELQPDLQADLQPDLECADPREDHLEFQSNLERDREADHESSSSQVREIERMMQAFAGELSKLDESLGVLSAYVRRMRQQPDSPPVPEKGDQTLH
jgi:hypothetical protein